MQFLSSLGAAPGGNVRGGTATSPLGKRGSFLEIDAELSVQVILPILKIPVKDSISFSLIYYPYRNRRCRSLQYRVMQSMNVILRELKTY